MFDCERRLGDLRLGQKVLDLLRGGMCGRG